MARLQGFISRWCWLCTAFGLVLVAMSATAAAQDANGAVLGFQARDVITGLLGLLLTIMGAFTAGFRSRVDGLDHDVKELSKSLADFKQAVAKDYHDKAEIAERLGMIDRSMEAMHRRFDQLNVPQVPRA